MKKAAFALLILVSASPAKAEVIELNCTADEMVKSPWRAILDLEKAMLTWPDDDTSTMVFEIVRVSEKAIIAVGNLDTNPDEVILLNRKGSNSFWVSLPENDNNETSWTMECFRAF